MNGFTNKMEGMVLVRKFRDDAVADGWEIRPTYENHEDISRAASLSKDGYTMSILTREDVGKRKYEASITIWADDNLRIIVPEVYNWQEIQRMKRHCNNCGKDDVDTQRYSFAGRCCAECRPEMAKKHEYPGWTN